MAQPLFAALRLLGYDAIPQRAQAPAVAAILADPVLSRLLGWVVRAAVKVAGGTERFHGPQLYYNPNTSFTVLIRRLRKGESIGMGGDGMGGTDFAEVPFLGGTLRLPTGSARLSAHTGAPILPIFALPEGLSSHRLIVHPPLHCPGDGTEAIRETMTAYAALFGEYIQAYPWAWWSWRRLTVGYHADGRLRLNLWLLQNVANANAAAAPPADSNKAVAAATGTGQAAKIGENV
jgi:lauroyl/myristoyl acyltransferase